MSKNKITLLCISLAYLVLTLYLFLTKAGIEVVLLFAIFSYIFYTPLVAIFKYDIDEIENENITHYLHWVAWTLFGALVLYSIGLFGAETFLAILKYIVANLPKFEFPDMMPFFKALDPIDFLVLAIVVIVLWVYILYLIAIVLILWLLLFLFKLLFGFIIIVAYLLSSLALLGGLIYIAYKGKKIAEPYVKSDFQRATILFSTIISALYLIVVFYINLFTLS